MSYNQPVPQQETTGISASEDRSVSALHSHFAVMNGTDLLVTQRAAGANLSVDVAAGTAHVPQGTGTETIKRGWVCTSTSLVNLAISAAPGTGGQSRYDLIVAQVRDNTVDVGGLNDWYLRVVEGTAAASPVDPAQPANSLLLARVTIAFGNASVTNSMITDLRTSNTARGLAGQTRDAVGGTDTLLNSLRHDTTNQRLSIKKSTDINNGINVGADGGLFSDGLTALQRANLQFVLNTSAPGTDAYFMPPGQGRISSVFATNSAIALPVMVNRTCTLKEVIVRSWSTLTSSTLYAVLYGASASTGRPNTKIAELGSVGVSAVNTNYTVSVSSPPTLTAGTLYYVVLHSGGTGAGGLTLVGYTSLEASNSNYVTVSEAADSATPHLINSWWPTYPLGINTDSCGGGYLTKGTGWGTATAPSSFPGTGASSGTSPLWSSHGGNYYAPRTILRMNYVA